MAADDLGTPLGSGRTGPASGRWSLPFLPLVAGFLASVIAVGLIWMVVVDDPLGGEPFAVAPIEVPQAKVETPALPAGPVPRGDAPIAGSALAGAQTITIIDGKSGARTEVPVPSGAAADNAAETASPLDNRLAESSRHGAIPRVGPDGTRPLDVYSRADASIAGRKGPQIAVVVGGLGISASLTGEAIAKLPSAITLAFAPYGSDLPRWVARANDAGHEILLQIPMEPFDYPDNDPGPQTLLASLPPAQNLDRLHWFLSRIQGYVGVTNLMGARFTSNEAALAPMLSDIARRGLLYFDDGSSARSVAHKVAAGAKAPFLKADLVVDAKAKWSDIDAALEKLERLAAERGFAVGAASALPISIERIARWAKAAEGRGVWLVPLSAIAARAKQS